jgi:AraC-like DNA-binding protein
MIPVQETMPSLLCKYNDLPDPELGMQISARKGMRGGPILEKHWHDHIQFMLFEKGHSVMHCHAGAIPMGPKSVVVVNPGELHYLEDSGIPLDFIIVKISSRFLQGSLLQPVMDRRYLFSNDLKGDPEIRKQLQGISQEYEARRPGWQLSIRSMALGLLARLVRFHVDQELSSLESHLQQEQWRRMGEVLRYLDMHFAEDIALAELARMVCQSPAHFCRLFRKLTGFSSREYQNRLRIQKASDLLKDSQLNIAQIGFNVGFHDSNYFSRAFRKVKGLSPKEYRTGFLH